MISKIKNGIRELERNIEKMIANTTFYPNTIRMHPSDVKTLRGYRITHDKASEDMILTIFGLKIIQTTKVDVGTCEVYNDEFFIEDLKHWRNYNE
jgi:phosphoribosyl 1,2-cyclic phosphodiesterase